MSGGRWTFVDVESGTVEEVGASTWCVDVEALTRDEADVLGECEPTGFYGETALEILEVRGVALERALDVVDGLRVSSSLDVESLARAVDCARVLSLESRLLEDVRRAAVDELRRALLMLECIGSGDFDSTEAAEWLEVVESQPSGLHGALVEAADALDVEVLVRSQLLAEHGGSLEEWASSTGYRWDRARSTWVDDEHGDDVDDLEVEFERAVSTWVDHKLGRGRFAPRAAAVESSPIDLEGGRS